MQRNRLIFLKDKTIENEEYHFLLLHHFNSTSGEVFDSTEETLFSDKKNKYSILRYFDNSFAISQKFFFLLEFPEHNCHYYFEQNKNPLEAEEDEDVTLKTIGPTCQGKVPFNGLTKSSSVCLLNGVKTDDEQLYYWYFPIGQRIDWQTNLIPAFTSPIHQISLWVQIENFSLLSRFRSILSCRIHRRLTLHLFLSILYLS